MIGISTNFVIQNSVIVSLIESLLYRYEKKEPVGRSYCRVYLLIRTSDLIFVCTTFCTYFPYGIDILYTFDKFINIKHFKMLFSKIIKNEYHIISIDTRYQLGLNFLFVTFGQGRIGP